MDNRKLRVWWIPQIGCKATMYIEVENEKEGKKLLDILACYDLFQLENNIKPDFCNTGGLQVFNDEVKEWEDWELETEDGWFDDIDSYFEDDEEMNLFSKNLFGQLKRR